ncbi:uncharacterized protein LOC124270386 [Haliotis rubra]|uniref:uncharacterized protein LOC124270386 n=1 Tax=Haliotis rubra TaxID=36100 RepID=UPI001EE57EBA|nr:uncharacterized protein LOC124270386 [Haliotis rubra]
MTGGGVRSVLRRGRERRDKDLTVDGKRGEYERFGSILEREEYIFGGGGGAVVGGGRERGFRDGSVGEKQGEYGDGKIWKKYHYNTEGMDKGNDDVCGAIEVVLGDGAVVGMQGECDSNEDERRGDRCTGGREGDGTVKTAQQQYVDGGRIRTGDYIKRERITKRQDSERGQRLSVHDGDRHRTDAVDGDGQNMMVDIVADVTDVQNGLSNIIVHQTVHVKNLIVMPRRVGRRRKLRPRSRKVATRCTQTVGEGAKVTRNTETVGEVAKVTRRSQTVGEVAKVTRRTQTVGEVAKVTRHIQTVGEVANVTRHTQTVGEVANVTRHTQTVGEVAKVTRHTQTVGEVAKVTRRTQTVGEVAKVTRQTKSVRRYLRPHGQDQKVKNNLTIWFHVLVQIEILVVPIVMVFMQH